MKSKHISSLLGGSLLLLASAMTACNDFDYETPSMVTPVATVQANTTIEELKNAYWPVDGTVNGQKLLVETDYVTQVGTKPDGSHYIISGRVISSDRAGNVYKSLYIQDASGALPMSINQNSLYNTYRIGQEVVIDVTGMYIGMYRGLMQLGFPKTASTGNVEASFMPPVFFDEHVQLNGLPDPAKIDTLTVTSFNELGTSVNLPTVNDLAYWQGRIVRFQDVEFVEGGEADFTDGYKITTSRELKDSDGNILEVRTSGYANFREVQLPKGKIDLVALVGYYSDSYQLTLNDVSGIEGVTFKKGTEANPYTTLEAAAIENAADYAEDTFGWVSGYIVGSVAPEVSAITSSSDILWDGSDPLGESLVIAPTADCRDISQIVVFALPADSELERVGNLRDNPDNLGKEMRVYGKLAKVLSATGVTNITGDANSFWIEGAVMPDDPTPEPPTGNVNFVRATSILPGHYYILVDNSGKVAIPIAESYTYGYLYVEDPIATSADGVITTSAANAIAIESAAGGFTMKDSYGRYLAMDDNDSHKSFQLYTTSNSGCVWTMSVDASSKLTATNNLRTTFTVRYVSNFSNFSPSTNTGDALPNLYVLDDGTVPNPGPIDPTPTPTPGDMEGDGTQANPYTVTDVIAFNPQSTSEVAGDDQASVWVTGYIVGFYDNYTNHFTADGAIKTNILLGKTATSTAASEIIAVQLPSGNSTLQGALNLQANPSLLGQKVSVQGDILKYCSMPGVKNTSAYDLDGNGGGGDDPTPTPTPGEKEGDGTEADPYTVADVIAFDPQSTSEVAGDDQANVWVTGYIVGCIVNFQPVFSAEGAVETCILLGKTATTNTTDDVIGVQLPKGDVRSALNLKTNPSLFGQKVSVQGDILKYNSLPGVRNTSAYKL
ncbi:MAG: DUF6359 domain-containing protein [Candidatus Amulumruptor caecigallinarius]|nr:DUF6359 domain-containing protein [Candidatus Amulumruptor caecigallinarius]MCM1397387.1 DUF6359 domain-containing protein [Candidatus Amulumruptor caecigallinarius]MCM1454472.1 DUF6359 domain-containing protein [bacterium]